MMMGIIIIGVVFIIAMFGFLWFISEKDKN